MSIAMEQFGSSEQKSELLASSGSPGPGFPYRLQCRSCGFDPRDVIVPPPRCPKCAGHSWERFVFPGSLLMHTDRLAKGSPASRSSFASADAI
jgi:hypothetical protein